MDYQAKRYLADELRNLDRAVQRCDWVATNLCVMRVNRMLEAPQTRKALFQVAPSDFTSDLPPWMRDIVKDQGIRLKALERAFGMRKVIIAPTNIGEGVGAKLRMQW